VSGARVLVVEDDPDLAALEADVLAERGHDVEVANNGREALDAVARHKPDLILLDMKMPVMGGREFAEEYRRREPHTAPIVVVTAADDAQRRAAEVGASAWLGKPFDPEALLEKVDDLLPR
jgi:CheY-like chemotaxis protein